MFNKFIIFLFSIKLILVSSVFFFKKKKIIGFYLKTANDILVVEQFITTK